MISAGALSQRLGRIQAIGPYLYVDRGGFMLHLYARYFRVTYQQGLHWGYALRINDRFVLFGGRR